MSDLLMIMILSQQDAIKKKTRDLQIGDVVYSSFQLDTAKIKALGISVPPSKSAQTTQSQSGTVTIWHAMIIVEKDPVKNTARGLPLTSQKPRHAGLAANQKACLIDATQFMKTPKPSYILPELVDLNNPDEVCV